MDEKSKVENSITSKRPTLTLKFSNSPLLKKIELLKAKTASVTKDELTKSQKPAVSLPIAKATASGQAPSLPKAVKKDKNNKSTNKTVKVAASELTKKESKESEAKEDLEKKNDSGSKDKKDGHTNKKKAKKSYKDNKDNKVKNKEAVQPRKLLMSRERYGAILLDLQQRFPDCFSKPTKPLAVGIHVELRETGLYSRSVIRHFLKVYCLMSQYKACLEPGQARVNLDGTVSSVVI